MLEIQKEELQLSKLHLGLYTQEYKYAVYFCVFGERNIYRFQDCILLL